jgi:NAD(P)-dependent dehydrogenase (short-subunit alcohol dehydrogenase family)
MTEAAARRIAMVTGAGSGVGKAAALGLAAAGWTLVLAGRRREPLEAVAAEIGGESLVVPTDVGDETAVARLFAATRERFGRLDLLFNNAGLFSPSVPLDELPVATLRSVLDANLLGVFLCTREAMALMKAQSPRGGRIINNGSISAHAPRPNSAPYTATKHAITGLTKSVALDGRAFDIACGQIDIGNAATDMTTRMADGVPQADGRLAVEPRMDVKHVADAIVWMASLPPEANVPFLTVMATKMPFVGRG